MSDHRERADAEAREINEALGRLSDSIGEHSPGAKQRFLESAGSARSLLQRSRHLSRETRAVFREELSKLCAVAKEQAEQRHHRSVKNVEQIGQLLSQATSFLNQDIVGKVFLAPQFKSFFDQLEIVKNRLRAEKDLRRDDRNALWERVNEAYRGGKELQKREWNKRREQSETRFERIIDLVKDAELSLDYGKDSEADFRKADASLQEAFLWIKGDSSVLSVWQSFHHELIHEHREEAFGRWSSAKDRLREARERLRTDNYKQMRELAEDALDLAKRGQSREARQKVKDIHISMKGRSLRQDEFQEVKDILQSAFDEAKQADLSRAQANLSRLEEVKEKKKGLIDRIKDLIFNLEEKEADARSDDFAEKVRGWISEKEEFLSKLEEQLEEIEEKIGNVEQRIRELDS